MFEVRAKVKLGSLSPDALSVELYVGPSDRQGELADPVVIPLLQEGAASNGTATYSGAYLPRGASMELIRACFQKLLRQAEPGELLTVHNLVERRRHRMSPLLARHPRCYSPDPCPEGRVTPVLLRLCERWGESLLDDVMRDLAAACDRSQGTPKPEVPLARERRECLPGRSHGSRVSAPARE